MSGERKRRIVPDLAWEPDAPPSPAAGPRASGGAEATPDRLASLASATPALTRVAPTTSPTAAIDVEPAAPTAIGRATPATPQSATGTPTTSVDGDALETTTVRVRVRSLDWLDQQVKSIRRRSRSGLTRSQLLAAYLTALEDLGVSAPTSDGPDDLVLALKARIVEAIAK